MTSIHRADPAVAVVMEAIASAAYADEPSITEVIRPAAVVPALSARAVVAQLERPGGHWAVETSCWRRFDRPWDDGAVRGESHLIGTMQLAHGTPTRFDITIYRVTITAYGERIGWTVSALCDEALRYGGLTLESCPRAGLRPPPPVFRSR